MQRVRDDLAIAWTTRDTGAVGKAVGVFAVMGHALLIKQGTSVVGASSTCPEPTLGIAHSRHSTSVALTLIRLRTRVGLAELGNLCLLQARGQPKPIGWLLPR